MEQEKAASPDSALQRSWDKPVLHLHPSGQALQTSTSGTGTVKGGDASWWPGDRWLTPGGLSDWGWGCQQAQDLPQRPSPILGHAENTQAHCALSTLTPISPVCSYGHQCPASSRMVPPRMVEP